MRILYLEGDAASPKYVRGALRHLRFDVELATEPPPRDLGSCDLYLLSDMPAERVPHDTMRAVEEEVRRGAGLLMVGGWLSFGRGGYARTVLGNALPVTMRDGDDREAAPSGAWLVPAERAPLTDGLPWDRPPVVTGWNKVASKVGGRVLVEARPLQAGREGPRLTGARVPILVVGKHGDGRTAALATDLAPHWSGGWTDWGSPSYDVGEGEELGAAYIDFLGRLCRWLMEPRGEQAEAAQATP